MKDSRSPTTNTTLSGIKRRAGPEAAVGTSNIVYPTSSCFGLTKLQNEKAALNPSFGSNNNSLVSSSMHRPLHPIIITNRNDDIARYNTTFPLQLQGSNAVAENIDHRLPLHTAGIVGGNKTTIMMNKKTLPGSSSAPSWEHYWTGKNPTSSNSCSIINRRRTNKKKKTALAKKKKSASGRVYIDKINDLDVLCGRGGRSNHHCGNKLYRQIVKEMKTNYRSIDGKKCKTNLLSQAVVRLVVACGGRFVKKEHSTGRYYLLSRAEARKKTSQALREEEIE